MAGPRLTAPASMDAGAPIGRRGASADSAWLVTVSEEEELEAQAADAIEFLARHGASLNELGSVPGFVGVLDFGVFQRSADFVAKSYRFPAALVSRAGVCGLALELSVYATSDEDP